MSESIPAKASDLKGGAKIGSAELAEIAMRLRDLSAAGLFSSAKLPMLNREVRGASTASKLNQLLSSSLGTSRVGDRERDIAVSLLNEHFVAGRLTSDESDQRRSLALTAKTQADLVRLLVDLPTNEQDVMPTRIAPPRRRKGVAGFIIALIVAIAVIISLIIVISHHSAASVQPNGAGNNITYLSDSRVVGYTPKWSCGISYGNLVGGKKLAKHACGFNISYYSYNSEPAQNSDSVTFAIAGLGSTLSGQVFFSDDSQPGSTMRLLVSDPNANTVLFTSGTLSPGGTEDFSVSIVGASQVTFTFSYDWGNKVQDMGWSLFGIQNGGVS